MPDYIFIIGFMGAGKTHYASELSKEIGYKHLDSDDWIEKKKGLRIAHIFYTYGEHYFRGLESDFLNHLPVENAIISCGGGMPCFHDHIFKMKEMGKVIWLHTDFETIWSRISNDPLRPLVWDYQSTKKLYEGRLKYYNLADEIRNI